MRGALPALLLACSGCFDFAALRDRGVGPVRVAAIPGSINAGSTVLRVPPPAQAMPGDLVIVAIRNVDYTLLPFTAPMGWAEVGTTEVNDEPGIIYARVAVEGDGQDVYSFGIDADDHKWVVLVYRGPKRFTLGRLWEDTGSPWPLPAVPAVPEGGLGIVLVSTEARNCVAPADVREFVDVPLWKVLELDAGFPSGRALSCPLGSQTAIGFEGVLAP